jgi:hypothetical protein
MNGYNPNETMLPASNGPIVAMSGGGCSPAIPSTGGGGAGLVFANGGARKPKKQRGGLDKPTMAIKPSSNPDTIDDILKLLTGNPSMVKKQAYTKEDQTTILMKLLPLLQKNPDKFVIDVSFP